MVTKHPVLLALLLAVSFQLTTSRAVNISSVWLLPEEGFPVFYRYFKDRITWFEADAVCQFHHANLVTVDSSEQYDATRAYLKELDVVNNVWVGLKRSGSEGEFTWTDYKPLENGGYWQEQIPLTDNPVCAALDPAADFRWHPLSCGGPEVASFICQLEVPGWARKEDGCMVTSLPSLTVTYLPEQGAVELISDCGLDGTRRIACKGQANREEMMKQLSCESSTEGQTEATSSNTWDNDLPTRHRRDTEVTVDMASLPTTQGLAELNTTDASTEADEAKEVFAVNKEAGVTSTQVLPQEMSAVEEPIKSTIDILTDKPAMKKLANTTEIKAQTTGTPNLDNSLFDEEPIHIPLNSIAKITSDESGNSQEEKLPEEKRQVVVQSKPIPPSLRGNSPFPVSTIAPGKNETTGKVEDTNTQKPIEKESHEVFRESKANVGLPEKPESKLVNFPPLSVYNVNSDRDPDESSARVDSSQEDEKLTTVLHSTSAPMKQDLKEMNESKFFTRVVAEESTTTTSTATPVQGTKSTSKPDTGNDFFVATETPLLNSETPTKLTSPSVPETEVPKQQTTKQEPAPALIGIDLNRPAALTADTELADETPEAPERPNRGRLLIRPQHRSFYPYFLNRVLG